MPNIFGYSLVTILSESMTNSGFEIDDAVMVKSTDSEELKVGDVIAYYKYIETTSANLSDIARAEKTDTATATEVALASGGDSYSRVSSWKLYLSKLFSNITYTATEASEKAIKANSTIIFHQIVDIVEYDGYRWFKTWGTSNLDARGDPVYDAYWIREDYVIGRYTHTSSTVRSFLSFASTNSGILWMVEVPSGVHLILSTLELVEILDMMTKERHERIKNGTYIDRREYKRMLRAKRKMLASGNIDIETFRKMYPNYDNFEIVYSENENNKHNVNINGPPDSDGYADDKHTLYGTGATSKVGDSPPKGRAPDGREGLTGDQGESPPNKAGPPADESPPNTGPPYKSRGDTGDGKGADESPPNTGPPYKSRGDTGDESPPNKNGPPNNKGDSPPNKSVQSAELDTGPNGRASKGEAKIDKALYAVSTGGLYDGEDKAQEQQELHNLQSLASQHNTKANKARLAENEVVLSEKDLQSMIDIYPWTTADFIANTDITHKGVISKPDKKNKIYLVSKKTKRQFSLASLGKILSVNTGLITTESGIYKYILSTSGVKFEKLQVDPKFTIISAKQDLFGNVFIGITGGDNQEVTYKTSDGKLVSIWNRNALLTIGDNHKLYYISMEKSYDLDKGVITDLKVMNKDGKLVSASSDKIKQTIKFVDGFEKYGFIYLTPSVLCLKEGKMFFELSTKKTTTLTDNQWLTQDNFIVEHNTESKKLIKISLDEFLKGTPVDDQSGTIVTDNVKKVKKTGPILEIDAGSGKLTINLLA